MRERFAGIRHVLGLLDRGVIASGYKADVNVIDLDHLHLYAPEVVHDLPTGGRRLVQRADGYSATIVSGRITRRDGFATDCLPSPGGWCGPAGWASRCAPVCSIANEAGAGTPIRSRVSS
ncbi:MAG: hypothetical protein R3E46_14750 [Sedimenticolaceae bacterium]